MTANERTNALTVVELTLAAALMILAGASIVALAFAAPAGASPAITPTSLAPLALGLVLVASGIESLRRRHFLFAVVIPTLMALANLGYVIATSQWVALSSVVMFLVVVVLVRSRRSAFRD